MNPIVQKHGPFSLLGGQHIEDVPVGVVATVAKSVKELGTGGLVLKTGDGKEHKVLADSNGVLIDWHGQPVSCYREMPGGRHRRVAATALNVGDEVELCREVTYGPPDAEESFKRRFPNVLFQSFRSKDDLTLLNKPPAMKFVLDNDSLRAGEMDELRKQNEELRERLAALEAQKGQPQGQQDKQNQPQRKAG